MMKHFTAPNVDKRKPALMSADKAFLGRREMQLEDTFFERMVEELYAVDSDAMHLHSLSEYSFDWRGIYRVELADGRNWVLRACRQDSDTSWYLKPAATLLFLEQQHYPAPRLVRTRTGELIGTYNGWWTLMTTFIEGERADNTHENLRLLANMAGALHLLSKDAAAVATPPVQASWKLPQQAVPECLQQLAQVRNSIPFELRAFCNEVSESLERIQQANLPTAVIHADCWPGNAVRTPDGQIVLIDWDGAGFGPPILDVGTLLLTCHFNQPPLSLLRADASSIVAIVEGYCPQRLPTSSELAMLEDAVRFNSAFHFARDLQSILQGEWRESIELKKLQIRYEGASEIALIARTCFEQALS